MPIKLNDISIRNKLFSGFGVVCILFIISGFSIYFNNQQTLKQVEDSETKVLPHTLNFMEIRRDVEQIQSWLTDISATRAAEGYDDGFKEAKKYYQDAVKRIDFAIVEHKKFNEDEMISVLGDLKKSLDEYYDMGKQMALVYIADGPAMGNIMMEKFDPFAATISSQIEKIVTEHISDLKTAFVSTHKSITATTKTLTIAVVVVLILSIFITFLIATPISRSLSKAVDCANKIADGDLTQQLEIDQKDEIGILSNALNEMIQKLRGMFTDIASSTKTLNTSATELSAISEQIATNSTQTAENSNNVSAAAEEMATNMGSVATASEQTTTNIQMIVSAAEEMTSTINEIANNTAKGSETTSRAVETAKHVSGKVNELGVAAKEINKVTDTIADISEQTNLLALNATIEAARAGEAGKGFTVVAGEIKTLAQQTAEATDEISSQIVNIQTTTIESVTAIESIVGEIDEINSIVTTIATAIEEQSATTQEIANNVAQAATGVQEVTENVNQTSTVAGEVTHDISQVRQATEEMNDNSHQVMTSATELSELAEKLNEMVGRFNI